jgi:hypothetical protein
LLIKERDNRDADLAELRKLLDREITTKQRFLIEREMKFLGSGVRGEDSSAYYIDYHYKNSKNWVVIHDLRVRYEDFIAQIDHLLINRFLDIYVLESKNYYYGIKITTQGEFMAWNGKTYIGIESPIEQNKRHIHLLEKVITRASILPTRLGIPIPPTYYNYILVSPTSRIDRPPNSELDTSIVIKADALVSTIDKRVDKMSMSEALTSGVKMVTLETVEAFAKELIKRHRPAKMNYAAKFGIPAADSKPPSTSGVANGILSDVVAEKTAVYKKAEARPTANKNEKAKNQEKCNKCGADVDSKVVFFCRMNKQKFGGNVFCRSCQASYRAIK